MDDRRYQNGRNSESRKKEKIKAQTANILRHPDLSASDTRRKIDETYEAVAPSVMRKGSKKLPGEDVETKRLGKRLRAAITAREKQQMTYASNLAQRKEDNCRLIKLAAHQPATLFDLLKGEGQAQQLTHAIRDKDGKLLIKADEVHARLEQAWQDEVFWRKKDYTVRVLQRPLLVEYATIC